MKKKAKLKSSNYKANWINFPQLGATDQEIQMWIRKTGTGILDKGQCACKHLQKQHRWEVGETIVPKGTIRIQEAPLRHFAPKNCKRCKCSQYEEDNLEWLMDREDEKKLKEKK